MTARILDGKSIAMMLEEALAKQSAALEKRAGRKPGLFVVLVGDDPASAVYVRNKTRACARTGVNCFESILPASTSQDELLDIIDEANAREDVDGILVQLPLPAHICAEAVIDRIAPEKDVDGFHMLSAGALLTGPGGKRKGGGGKQCDGFEFEGHGLSPKKENEVAAIWLGRVRARTPDEIEGTRRLRNRSRSFSLRRKPLSGLK